MMELVSEAVAFAVRAHDGMRRKKSEAPYILHPMEAAVIVGTMTDDQNLIAAAALHDVVEDAGVTIEEVGEKFGKRVQELVQSETEDKREELPPADTWRIRKEESLEVLKNTDDIAVTADSRAGNGHDILPCCGVFAKELLFSAIGKGIHNIRR